MYYCTQPSSRYSTPQTAAPSSEKRATIPVASDLYVAAYQSRRSLPKPCCTAAEADRAKAVHRWVSELIFEARLLAAAFQEHGFGMQRALVQGNSDSRGCPASRPMSRLDLSLPTTDKQVVR